MILNMAFNMGVGTPPKPAAPGKRAVAGTGLLGFANTLAMVERGDYERAARNMRLSEMMRTGRAA